MIQIRHVPAKVHQRLKARAALEGLSLSEYLLREVTEISRRPTPNEMQHRLASRPSVEPIRDISEQVRSERDNR